MFISKLKAFRNISCFILIATAISNVYSQPSQKDIITGIKAGLYHDYELALDIFKTQGYDYPENPTGPFFTASILQSKMMDFETSQWERDFFEQIQEAEIRARNILASDPQDTNARFCLGGALAYKGFYLSRKKKYFSGIRTAMAAIDQLEKVIEIDSLVYDAYLGIGNYKYWRSRLTGILNWLPFFSDQREEALELILLSLKKGTYTRWAALNDLAWIYIDRNEPEEALKYALIGLDEFPDSRFFLWPAADAYLKNGDYFQARTLYEKLLHSVTSESINNHYNEILLHLKIAQCAYEMNELEDAQFHCIQLLNIEPQDEVLQRVQSKYDRAKKLLRKINQRKPVLIAN